MWLHIRLCAHSRTEQHGQHVVAHSLVRAFTHRAGALVLSFSTSGQRIGASQAKMWTSAMSMYRQLEKWEDAKRVAKAEPMLHRNWEKRGVHEALSLKTPVVTAK